MSVDENLGDWDGKSSLASWVEINFFLFWACNPQVTLGGLEPPPRFSDGRSAGKPQQTLFVTQRRPVSRLPSPFLFSALLPLNSWSCLPVASGFTLYAVGTRHSGRLSDKLEDVVV